LPPIDDAAAAAMLFRRHSRRYKSAKLASFTWWWCCTRLFGCKPPDPTRWRQQLNGESGALLKHQQSPIRAVLIRDCTITHNT
jgi:hypothetical protein